MPYKNPQGWIIDSGFLNEHFRKQLQDLNNKILIGFNFIIYIKIRLLH